MASVTFDEATRLYPNAVVPAVDHLSLSVSDGEFFVLAGPSGCGKSTAMRMLAGLENVDAGHIFVDSEDVTHLPPKMRDVAIVFQNYALYPHMSIEDNMGFTLKIAGKDPDFIAERVRDAAEVLELDGKLQEKPGDLSRAERQRVAMGRALVRSPKVFLMDEPLINLDLDLRDRTRDLIVRLQEHSGVTTVYVTADPEEAINLGTRVGIMSEGKLLQADTPEELLNHPECEFVRHFLKPGL
ncbi:ABC transporter ATP-binding protein [Actinobaculum massiliense]|uniref:ABC transporter ATP-binding protein n=1 Tax=Actinobaculum massiliense TaxID=202789 RepID=UPI00288B904B|nr:ABC transporter ATP-binding protein [Actinobaculum massiliense]